MNMQYQYYVENETMTGPYFWPVKEISYSDTIPAQPMPSSASWRTHIPHLNETLYSVFTNIAALIAVAIYCYCLCKWSRSTKFLSTRRETFEEQLAQKDAELTRVNALNEENVETINSINAKRAVETQEMKSMTKELQWYCVNYPILEGANVILKDQAARDSEQITAIAKESDEWRQEAEGLRVRLAKVMASIPHSSIPVAPVSRVSIGGTGDECDLMMQLTFMKTQKKLAVADKLKAEAERDQAVSAEKKAAEECSRKATSLEVLMGSSDRSKSDLQKKVKDLESTVDHLTNTVKGLEAENNRQEEALKSLADDGVTLRQTKGRLQSEESKVRQLEKDLKDTKEVVKTTKENAAKSALDADNLSQTKDTKIRRLGVNIGRLHNLERRYAADIETWKKSEIDYNTKLQNLQASLSTCTTQYDNAVRDYSSSIRTLQQDLDTCKTEVEKTGLYHSQSASHVNYLKQILDGLMRSLGVSGNLDSPQGLEEVRRQLEHNLGQTVGCMKKLKAVLSGVMEISGVAGCLDNPKGLEEFQKGFMNFFASFEPMRLTPKVVKSLMEELQTLRQFKAHMLSAPQSKGQDEDPAERLQQANAKIQILGNELIKARSQASEKSNKVESLKRELKQEKDLKSAGVRSSQVDQSKIQKLEAEYDQLKKDMEDLAIRKVTATQQVEWLDEQAKKLRKEKEDLKKQKWNLWQQYNKARKECQGAEDQQQGADKRSHGDEGDSDDEAHRSAKQARCGVVAGKGTVS
ncbi:MAG: hypothetical protein Q9213_006207 [Squamulea squamosa]